jgi:DNA-binding FadR family transcriptional regulator
VVCSVSCSTQPVRITGRNVPPSRASAPPATIIAAHAGPSRSTHRLIRACSAFACRRAAELATAEQLGALRHALAGNERAIGRARVFAATDVAFHRVLTEIPGNPIFLAAHEALVDWLVSQRL